MPGGWSCCRAAHPKNEAPMTISLYSSVMAVAWFSIASLLGGLLLRKASRIGLSFLVAAFLLAIVRVLLPLDLKASVILHSTVVYPWFMRMLRLPLFDWLTVGKLLLLLWGTGTCAKLIWLLRALVLQGRFRRNAVPVEPEDGISALLADVSREMRCNQAATAAVSPDAATAYQVGFLHPYILLPRNISDFSRGEIQNMLRHELCHFIGGDLWIKLGLQVMTCVLWWNPAMYLLNRSVSQMLELRCDRRVCEKLSPVDELTYLETLLHLAGAAPKYQTSVSAGYVGTSAEQDITQRFEMVLREEKRPATKAKVAVCIFVCALLFVATFFITVQPFSPAPPEDIEGCIDINPQNSYLVLTAQGTYDLYVDGEFLVDVPKEELSSEPFLSMNTYKEGELP